MFKPTYLYIKRHKITEKLYFGKMSCETRNIEIYNGSGKYWSRHIQQHGIEHVETLWYCLFLDKKSCVEFATMFSEQNDIVNSTEWLNLKSENGLDGGSSKGRTLSQEHRENMSLAQLGNKRRLHSDETKIKIRLAGIGRNHSPETKYKMSISAKEKQYTPPSAKGFVSVFDINEREFKRITKEEFSMNKNIKYVGHRAKIAQEYKDLGV